MVMTDDKSKYKNHYLDARLRGGSSASRDTKGEEDHSPNNLPNRHNQERGPWEESRPQEVPD